MDKSTLFDKIIYNFFEIGFQTFCKILADLYKLSKKKKKNYIFIVKILKNYF